MSNEAILSQLVGFVVTWIIRRYDGIIIGFVVKLELSWKS